MKPDDEPITKPLKGGQDKKAAENVGTDFLLFDDERQNELTRLALQNNCPEAARAMLERIPQNRAYRTLYDHFVKAIEEGAVPSIALSIMSDWDRLPSRHAEFSETTVPDRAPMKRLATTTTASFADDPLRALDVLTCVWVEAKANDNEQAVADAASILRTLFSDDQIEKAIELYARDEHLSSTLRSVNVLRQAIQHDERERVAKLLSAIEPSSQTTALMVKNGYDELAHEQVIDEGDEHGGANPLKLESTAQRLRTSVGCIPYRHSVVERLLEQSDEADVRPFIENKSQLRAVIRESSNGLEALPAELIERSLRQGWYDFFDRCVSVLAPMDEFRRRAIIRAAFRAGADTNEHRPALQRLLIVLKDRGCMNRELFEAALEGMLNTPNLSYDTLNLLYRYYGGWALSSVEVMGREPGAGDPSEAALVYLKKHNLTDEQYAALYKQALSLDRSGASPTMMFERLQDAELLPQCSDTYHDLVLRALRWGNASLVRALLHTWAASPIACELTFNEAIRAYKEEDSDYAPTDSPGYDEAHEFVGTLLLNHGIAPEDQSAVDYCFYAFESNDADALVLTKLLERGFAPSEECYRGLLGTMQALVKENVGQRRRQALQQLEDVEH